MLDDLKAARGSSGGTASPLTGTGANRLLAALGVADCDRLGPHLRQDSLATGQTLFEPGDPLTEVIFPAQGTVLSLQCVLPDRKPVETAAIGFEGAAGALLGAGQGLAVARCCTLTGGAALRIPADRFGEALEASPGLRAQMARYALALLGQVQHGLACAALHTVEARASAWMLGLLDRLGERALPVTQEALADLLGVRRTTITRVVATLEARGVIRHRRSRIIVVDRAGLEASSGEGYRRARAQFEQAAPGLYPAPPPDGAGRAIA